MANLPVVTGTNNIGSKDYPHGKIFFADYELYYTPLVKGYEVWGNAPARYKEAAIRYLTRKGIISNGKRKKKPAQSTARPNTPYSYSGRS